MSQENQDMTGEKAYSTHGNVDRNGTLDQCSNGSIDSERKAPKCFEFKQVDRPGTTARDIFDVLSLRISSPQSSLMETCDMSRHC